MKNYLIKIYNNPRPGLTDTLTYKIYAGVELPIMSLFLLIQGVCITLLYIF